MITPRHETIVLTWIPRLTGTLSILGSLSIMYMILSDSERKLAKPNHRLMLSLCIFDVIQSIAYATTTLALPTETNVYGAMGTDNTCRAQGFFILIGLSVPMFNASLNIFYLLTICYRVNQQQFAATVEPFLHIFSSIIPLIIAIISVSSDSIGPGPNACYIEFATPLPKVLFVVASLLSICFLISVYSMTSICTYVVRQSNKAKKYSYGSEQTKRRESEKKETVIQALLYTLAFLLTFSSPVIILLFANPINKFNLEIIKALLYPLQGFWNFLFYIRPGIKRGQTDFPDKCILERICDVIFRAKESGQTRRQTQREIRRMAPLRVRSNVNILSPPDAKVLPQKGDMIGADSNNDIENACVKFEESEKDTSVSNILGKDKNGSHHDVDQVRLVSPSAALQNDHNNELHHSTYFPKTLMMADDTSNIGIDSNSECQKITLQSLDTTRNLTESKNLRESKFENKGHIVYKRRRSSLLNLATVQAHYPFDDMLNFMEDCDECGLGKKIQSQKPSK